MPAESKHQQRLMGMAHACQKYGKACKSKQIKKLAHDMKPKDLEDFAKTKHKGLPEKVKSEGRLLPTFAEWLEQRQSS